MVTAGGGGGWGDPLDRDPEVVRMDIIKGYVSIEHARSDYGVVFSGDMTVDAKATGELRAKMRKVG
jgi:N-methylhydantoinase B